MKVLSVLLLCSFFAYSFSYSVNVERFEEVVPNTVSGVKIAFPELTLDLIVRKLSRWLEVGVKFLHPKDIHKSIESPIGKIAFDVQQMQITKMTITKPTFKILTPASIRLNLPDIYLQGQAKWKYKQHSFPHVSDSGHVDMDLRLALTMDFKVDISLSHKSHIEIISTSFNLNWKDFDVKLHGGASWLYNIFVKQVKGTIEAEVGVAMKILPKLLVNLFQHLLDAEPLSYPIGINNLDFSYLFQEVNFNVIHRYVSYGTLGGVEIGSQFLPTEPGKMPEIISGGGQCQYLFSEWAFQSSVWAAQHTGLLNYVLSDDSKLPIHLDSKYLQSIVPELEQKYPNKTMQITIYPTHGTSPTFMFDSSGYIVQADIDAVFQVIDSTDSSTVDVFTLSIGLNLHMNVSLSNRGRGSYSLSSRLGLSNNYNVTLKSSKVGQFDPNGLKKMIPAIFNNYFLPNLNKYYGNGVPIPSSKVFQLSKPNLQLFDGYLLASFDFGFSPLSPSYYLL